MKKPNKIRESRLNRIRARKSIIRKEKVTINNILFERYKMIKIIKINFVN